MSVNSNISIEKFHLLKLASLAKSEQKWILSKLKKSNKVAFKEVLKKLAEAKKFNLPSSDFNDVYEKLNLKSIFKKNELDEKIDALNLLPKLKYESYINELSYSDLVVFIFCDDILDIKQYIMSKICRSKEYIENKLDLSFVKNDRINTYLICYLYENLIEVKK